MGQMAIIISLIDVALLGDLSIKRKEIDKFKKCTDLRTDVARRWHVKAAIVAVISAIWWGGV